MKNSLRSLFLFLETLRIVSVVILCSILEVSYVEERNFDPFLWRLYCIC